MEPPSKRIRRYACPCTSCCGKERDHRTVQRHLRELSVSEHRSISSSSPASQSRERNPPSVDPDPSDNHSPIVVNPEPTEPISCTTQSPTSSSSTLPQNLTNYVVREALTKLECGYSRAQIERHLENATSLLDLEGRALPVTWPEVLQLLKKLGYRSPRHYKVCCGKDHSTLLASRVSHPVCPVCDRAWSDCIDYYVVGLNFQDWFQTECQCQALLKHWEDRVTWLGKPDSYDHPEKSELWHGK